MEPWDGPASIAFTDGRVIGAVLDRNGLRPSRYYVTKDDLVIMASEVGVLDIPAEDILLKERLHPGRLFLVDTVQGCIVSDDEVKRELAAAHPYGRWVADHLIDIEDLPTAPHLPPPSHERIVQRQQLTRYRKYAVLAVFIIAAIITPTPDPFNQTLVAVPLYLLYELGLFLARWA